ncbi:hypothetical protein ACLQ3H_16570 [Micromonospora saelicesensis]|uniref:hypothetical protein n=1 Tax=Micromonospora saelicesensis TaxID=285676 RepID=UPI003CE6B5BA
MLTPTEIASLIRVRLTQLGEENAHHEFEHLCRHVAQRRIASNVLPATGPVSSGGDQARDFETFRTYLAQELPFAIGFLALAAEDTIAFACTIQQEKLKTNSGRRRRGRQRCDDAVPLHHRAPMTGPSPAAARRIATPWAR